VIRKTKAKKQADNKILKKKETQTKEE